MDATASKPSTSAGSGLCLMQAGLGRRNDDGLELFSDLVFPDELIPESVRSTAAGRKPGNGRGCAPDLGLSAKLWHLDTCFDGDGDLDSARDCEPFSEKVSLLRLLDPPDLLVDLHSDGILNLRCMVSMILSFVAFFFASFDDDFPHHEGMFSSAKHFKSQ